jgi:hypothetical protein
VPPIYTPLLRPDWKILRPSRLHSNGIKLALLPPLLGFDDSDNGVKGSQGVDKQLTSPEVMALSKSVE